MTEADQIVRKLLENEEDDFDLKDLMADFPVQEAEEDDFEMKDLTPDSVEAWLERAGFKWLDGWWILKSSRVTLLRVNRIPGTELWKVQVLISGKPKDNAQFTDSELRHWLVSAGYVKESAEEEDDVGWKDVTPDAGVQRWVFTKYESRNPKECRADDHFYVVPENHEMGVIVQRNGKVTNTWADGIEGVPEEIREMADEMDTLFKFVADTRSQRDDWEAHLWLDVYVDGAGNFLGFVKPR